LALAFDVKQDCLLATGMPRIISNTRDQKLRMICALTMRLGRLIFPGFMYNSRMNKFNSAVDCEPMNLLVLCMIHGFVPEIIKKQFVLAGSGRRSYSIRALGISFIV
jgi:hypothetical protein